MNDLIEIQSQIEKLQQQAAEIRALDFNKNVQEILLKMTACGITTKDLEIAGGRTRKTTTPGGKTAVAKFRGPNGESWSGRGLTPRWMTALLAQGRKKEEFAI